MEISCILRWKYCRADGNIMGQMKFFEAKKHFPRDNFVANQNIPSPYPETTISLKKK